MNACLTQSHTLDRVFSRALFRCCIWNLHSGSLLASIDSLVTYTLSGGLLLRAWMVAWSCCIHNQAQTCWDSSCLRACCNAELWNYERIDMYQPMIRHSRGDTGAVSEVKTLAGYRERSLLLAVRSGRDGVWGNIPARLPSGTSLGLCFAHYAIFGGSPAIAKLVLHFAEDSRLPHSRSWSDGHLTHPAVIEWLLPSSSLLFFEHCRCYITPSDSALFLFASMLTHLLSDILS